MLRKPKWFKKHIQMGPGYEKVRTLITKSGLNTVCKEANCPNIWDCFSRKTATFLIMGSKCTRNCGFCAIPFGIPFPPDPFEALKIANAAKNMGLDYVVITSVTRDDLFDGGAIFFSNTIKKIRDKIPGIVVEVLIPDFKGDKQAIKTVADANPDVINHNIETCKRLYDVVRPQAVYNRSIELLKQIKLLNPTISIKSGMMLGLGEKPQEIDKTFKDLLNAGCRILTLGQYLQPTKNHIPIARYIHPEEFDALKKKALGMGFLRVASGPFVRSSYKAKDLYNNEGKI